MIQLQNISKTFHQKGKVYKALDNINLDVQKGTIVGIIGSSGAGKSTLIRCVNLLERPDTGSVMVGGKDLMRLNRKELAAERKKIGMVFQHFNLLSSKTVFENVALPLRLDKTDKEALRNRVDELLRIVGLEEKSGVYPNSLSGGQKQRVAIARALANSPHILLCDEATSALDPVTTQSVLELLKDINKQLGITILLITHEMEVIKSSCDQVAVIEQGKLVLKGKLDDLISENNPAVSQFITIKKMTIPKHLADNLKQEYTEGLFPLVEVELNGTIYFKKLIDTIQEHYEVPYNIIKADIEYTGKANFGKLLIHLKGTQAKNDQVIRYFKQLNLQNTVRGYAA